MTYTRRRVIEIGGGVIAALGLWLFPAQGADVVEIAMAGRPDGSKVWFDPIGILIEPGQTLRWTNRDAGNAHTATAYHPANGEHPARIPANATPWDSDYLLPEESYAVTLHEPGVYDYFCVPHEHAGMVGRIIVGKPGPRGWFMDDGPAEGVPEAALRAFPATDEIMRRGRVRGAAAAVQEETAGWA